MNIKQKIEAAFVAYLQSIDELSGLTIVPGGNMELEEYPLLIVHCRNAPEEPDLPSGSNEHAGALVLQLIVDSHDEVEAPTSVSWVTAIEEGMQDKAAMATLLNYTEDDDQPVPDFHFKDIERNDCDDGVMEDGKHVDSLEYLAHVANFSVAVS